MKLTDFDARRLRPREPRKWRSRFGMTLALLLITVGTLLALIGTASLFGIQKITGSMAFDQETATASLLLGLLLLAVGLYICSRVRRHGHGPSGIRLSPRLGKKR